MKFQKKTESALNYYQRSATRNSFENLKMFLDGKKLLISKDSRIPKAQFQILFLWTWYSLFTNHKQRKIANRKRKNRMNVSLPGVPGIVTFFYKSSEPLIFLGFFDFVKTIKLLITQKRPHKHRSTVRAGWSKVRLSVV